MKEIIDLKIRDLFSSVKYIIPIYQRDYAWGEKEIRQLLLDVVTAYNNIKETEECENKYYIGTLITHPKEESVFEVIDGQQRLTTLFILLCYINNKIRKDPSIDKTRIIDLQNDVLSFESRKESKKVLELLRNGEEIKTEVNNIIRGYNIIENNFDKILQDVLNTKADNSSFYNVIDFILDNVIILRVTVPKDTDLNQYFEIMNNRGEQLEKHEIIKALCMRNLTEQDSKLFGRIWDACSDMNRYVQIGFQTAERNLLFGNDGADKWNKFTCRNKDELFSNSNNTDSSSEETKNEAKDNSKSSLTLDTAVQLTELATPVKKENNQQYTANNDWARFNSVIDFPNFLLQVLKIFIYDKNKQTNEEEKVLLDDKKLIDNFNNYLLSKKDPELIKEFGYYLLKLRFLFDKYVIKREYTGDKDRWSLKRLKISSNPSIYYVYTFNKDENEDKDNTTNSIIMIQSMFHVSNPTMIYKHWLNGTLKWLNEHFEEGTDEIDGEKFLKYLQRMGAAFMYDHYLPAGSESNISYSFDDIIYTNNCNLKNREINESTWKNLDKGTAVENYIFNYLDYVLWLENENSKEKDDKISRFKFSFRSSVEHFYPQNPIGGDPLDPDDSDNRIVDRFGNLCLISYSKNSMLSNHTPQAKCDYYRKSNEIDSIKQYEMIKTAEKEKWEQKQIVDHENKMIKKLKDNLTNYHNVSSTELRQ